MALAAPDPAPNHSVSSTAIGDLRLALANDGAFASRTMMATTTAGMPNSRPNWCTAVGSCSIGHPGSVSRGTNMLKSSLTCPTLVGGAVNRPSSPPPRRIR